MANSKRHQELAAEQKEQASRNHAKFLAYAKACYGGGWLAECSGYINGFRSDYLMVHSNAADLACHRVQTIHVLPGEEKDYDQYLAQVLAACETANQYRPEVKTITDEDIKVCRGSVAKDFEDYQAAEGRLSLSGWLEQLLADRLDEWAVDVDKLAEVVEGK